MGQSTQDEPDITIHVKARRRPQTAWSFIAPDGALSCQDNVFPACVLFNRPAEPDLIAVEIEALAALDRAAGLVGSGPALERLCRAYRQGLGIPIAASDAAPSVLEPRTAWEHCDLGRAYLRDGEQARAAREFQQAVDLRPHDFWPNFYHGLCAYKLGRFQEALSAFRVCVSLAEHPAGCYFNRALAYESLGRSDEALRDYTRALECDDQLTGAALNRGILHYTARRYAEAAADLSRALGSASGREERGVIHYNRALVGLGRHDRPAALSDLKAASECGHAQARALVHRLDEGGAEKQGRPIRRSKFAREVRQR